MTEQKTEIVHISTPKAHYTLDFSSGTIRAKPIITNADRIRAMSDEELAENLFRHICNWSCPPQKEYIKASCGGEKPDCVKCWLDWLKQEV